MAPNVTVTYDLVLPKGTPRPKPESSSSSISHTRQIAPCTNGYKEYYDTLRTAIGEIKAATGHELTVWRDAVGNRELGKEVNMKGDDDEGSDKGGEEQ
ncbi:hypothetical protein EDB83DRAFT_2213710 [Lactarius deliciosus]|nr:hypothetical protein EDB83DRAFT_2213710 [Lactarius deliciosus]